MTKQTAWNLCLCLVVLFLTLSKAAELTREKRQAFKVEPFIVGNELGARGTYSNGGSKLTGHLSIDSRGRLASRGIGASHDFGSSSISGNFGRNQHGNFGGISGSTSFGQNKVGGSWNRGPGGSNSFGVGYERSFGNNRGSWGLSYGNSGGQSHFGANLKYRFKRSLPRCQYEVYCFISPCRYMDCPIGSVCVKDRCSCTAQCRREKYLF